MHGEQGTYNVGTYIIQIRIHYSMQVFIVSVWFHALINVHMHVHVDIYNRH